MKPISIGNPPLPMFVEVVGLAGIGFILAPAAAHEFEREL